MSWLLVLLGYLLGSIPTAYIAGRLTTGKDIRRMGDGNAGARNAYCELGAKTGIAVGTIDAGKGALAVAIAGAAGVSQPWVLLAGAAAVIGHNWPVFIGFRGGRGEATTIGVLLAVVTLPALIVAAPAIAAHLILRDTTRAAPFIFVPLPFVCWWLGVSMVLIAYTIALPCLVAFTHFLRTRQPARNSGRRSV